MQDAVLDIPGAKQLNFLLQPAAAPQQQPREAAPHRRMLLAKAHEQTFGNYIDRALQEDLRISKTCGFGSERELAEKLTRRNDLNNQFLAVVAWLAELDQARFKEQDRIGRASFRVKRGEARSRCNLNHAILREQLSPDKGSDATTYGFHVLGAFHYATTFQALR